MSWNHKESKVFQLYFAERLERGVREPRTANDLWPHRPPSHCCGDSIGSSADLQQGRGGGVPDRSLTRLHFQDTKTHRAAQAEYMDAQKRGNHGTLSAQLHNEKSNPLLVSILHVRLSMPVAEPLAPSAPIRPAQPPPPAGIPARESLSQRETETKQLINTCESVKSNEKKQEHPVSHPEEEKPNSCNITANGADALQMRWIVWCQETRGFHCDPVPSLLEKEKCRQSQRFARQTGSFMVVMRAESKARSHSAELTSSTIWVKVTQSLPSVTWGHDWRLRKTWLHFSFKWTLCSLSYGYFRYVLRSINMYVWINIKT